MNKKSTLVLAGAAIIMGVMSMNFSGANTLPVSMLLNDNITGGSGASAGTGTINVLKGKTSTQNNITLSVADLQTLRAASPDYGSGIGSTLIFAVDVNENASGLETSRAQGIAIESASISATINGTTQVVSTKFWTETRAMVAKSGTTGSACSNARQMRYTLLGDSGSSLITGRKISTSTFDSTLKFDVSQDLTNATAVTLKITLLKTDPSCGDPENFYDYSGGFEDMALITPADARIFDVLVPYSAETAFRAEAPDIELSPEGTATVTNELKSCTLLDTNGNCVLPGIQTDGGGSTTVTITLDATSTLVGNLGANGYTIVSYEDRYPNTGDYDFNDVVVAYKILKTTQLDTAGTTSYVTSISGDAYLVARGAGGYTHRWTLGIPVPAGATLAANPSCTTTKGTPNAVTGLRPLVTPGCTVTQASAGQPVQFVGFENTYALMTNMNTGANDIPTLDTIPKSSFSFTFDPPVMESAFSGLARLDPYIEILQALTSNRVPSKDDSPPNTLVVHLTDPLTGQSTRNDDNRPFVIEIPSDWAPPLEGIDIGLAYPEFSTFVTSSGANSKDWYMPAKSQSSKVVKWKVSQVTQ